MGCGWMQNETRVAVVGTGVIGASWAALFLAHGFPVDAWDPALDAETTLRAYLDQFLPNVAAEGIIPEQLQARLLFHESVEQAVEKAAFVQENGPENLAMKRALFARIDAALVPDAVIASSSSTLMPSDIQDACARPGRVLVGHPFNPPHLIPLVEVVAGKLTQPWATERAMMFYRQVGKQPIHIKREVRGHVANRLQAALWQEALHLVREGVVDVRDVDAAITAGPGLRWSCIGPITGLHLSGGEGGIAALFEKPLWGAVEQIWQELGRVTVDAALSQRVAGQVEAALAGTSLTELGHQRDEMLQLVLGHSSALAENGEGSAQTSAEA